MQDAKPQIVVPVTENELIATFSGPAPGANKFVITIGQPGVRIAFLEVHPDAKDQAFFRTAVTLHPLDAIQLSKVLGEMLKEIEKQILSVQTQNEAS